MECCFSHRKLETGWVEEVKKTNVLPKSDVCCKCEEPSSIIVQRQATKNSKYYCYGCYERYNYRGN